MHAAPTQAAGRASNSSPGVSPEPVVSDHCSLVVALAAAAAHRPVTNPPPGSHDPCLARFPARPLAAIAGRRGGGWVACGGVGPGGADHRN